MSRLRILVSGGSGFLGSHLCERLLKEGHEVVCLDNFFTGSRANIEHLLDDHRFELVRHDVTEPITMEVDQVYHLACPASPIHYQRNPVRTIRTAVEGTLNMLDLAREVQGPDPDRLDVRGVRRSDRAPAARELLGQRQPDRPARLLRRGEALRRGAGRVVRAPVRGRGAHRPHLQHLRPAHARERRARGLELRRAGAARASRSPSTARGSRRARSATRPISSRGSCASWPASTAPIRSTSATRARRRCCELAEMTKRLAQSKSRDHQGAAAQGRSDAPQARHRARPGAAGRLGAARSARGGAGRDHRRLQAPARRLLGPSRRLTAEGAAARRGRGARRSRGGADRARRRRRAGCGRTGVRAGAGGGPAARAARR